MSIFQRFEDFFQEFHSADMALLADLYSANLIFQDPVQQIQGLPALRRYFEHSLSGVKECRFEFLDTCGDERKRCFRWVMHFRHPKVAGGDLLHLNGMSFVVADRRIIFHQDSYDMGAMLYEHVPVLGFAVRKLKSGLSVK